MQIKYHPLALMEWKEAAYFYENQSYKLGIEFSKEIKATLIRISEFPEAWSKWMKNCRRCLLKRFPYGIVYKIGNKSITIYAIMHLNREPNYWFNRIRGNK
jgi:hypothetical protein